MRIFLDRSADSLVPISYADLEGDQLTHIQNPAGIADVVANHSTVYVFNARTKQPIGIGTIVREEKEEKTRFLLKLRVPA